MHFSTIAIIFFSTPGWAGYVLQDDYFSTGDFFSNFDFFTSPDPTHGFVEYKSQSDAASAGLTSSSGSNAKMSVDSTNVTPDGRPSVRITSKKSYSAGGLVVVDVAHMPGGVCGTWPAFWTVGPNWPLGGEIDIIEGVNDQAQNDMTLHTGPGCSLLPNTNLFSGQMKSSTCESSNGNNQGCQIASSSTDSFGSGFNAAGGGVYAMEWTGSSISVFFFPRNSVPEDVLGDSPDPSQWGTPVAYFGGGCDFATAFVEQQIVFDTTFCGDWAGAGDVWSSSTCSQHASSCVDFVGNNPSAFKDAYWSINALKVYSSSSGTSQPEPEPSETAAPEPVATSTPGPVASSTPEPASPSESGSGSGYAPWVGPDGTVNWGPSPQQSSAAAPEATGGSSGWTTGPDGFLNYGPGKRDERERALKHLKMHKRHGAGRV